MENNKIATILIVGAIATIVMVMAMAMAMPAMGIAPPGNTVTSNVTVTVGNVPPGVCTGWEEPDDDPITPGTQVMPEQHPITKTVTIKACVCDPNGEDDIASVTANVTGPGGFASVTVTLTRSPAADSECEPYTCPTGGVDCIQYNGTFEMSPCDPPEMYIVTVTVTDQSGATDTNTSEFEYLSLIAMTASNVNFGNVAPGGSSTANSTVIVYGNNPIEFVDVDPNGYDNPDFDDGIYWSDMMSGANVIPDDNITTTWDPNTCIDGCLGTANVPFTLDVPAGTQPGSYGGTITFTPSHC